MVSVAPRVDRRVRLCLVRVARQRGRRPGSGQGEEGGEPVHGRKFLRTSPCTSADRGQARKGEEARPWVPSDIQDLLQREPVGARPHVGNNDAVSRFNMRMVSDSDRRPDQSPRTIRSGKLPQWSMGSEAQGGAK
jgi:hypothetical protein